MTQKKIHWANVCEPIWSRYTACGRVSKGIETRSDADSVTCEPCKVLAERYYAKYPLAYGSPIQQKGG